MIALKTNNELAVSADDVMLSLPVPSYITRRLGGLYRMNYAPHITLAMGNKVFDEVQTERVREDFKEIAPFKITLDSLSVVSTPEGSMLWANAHIAPEIQYHIETELPYYNLWLSDAPKDSPWPHTPFNFRPHVTLRYRKRPFRWLPNLPKISWVQRWVEVVKGDTVVERIPLSDRARWEEAANL